MSDFLLPDLGEGIVECEVVAWHVAEGEMIAEDQPVVDVSTDKAVMEITAPEAGRLVRHYCQLEQVAKVHSPLFAYEPLGDELADQERGNDERGDDESSGIEPLAQGASKSELKAGSAAGLQAASETKSPDVPRETAPAEEASTAPSGPHANRIPASPAVRRHVRELGLSLEEIPGSGKHGRVLKQDVLAFHEHQCHEFRLHENRAEKTAGGVGAGVDNASNDRIEPLRGVRAIMAKRMSEAAATIPHFAYGDEFDVTELLALRERLKPNFEARGARLTLMPLLMKALALAVAEFPLLNCRLNDSADAIHYQANCNIGMAVDGRSGLIVPNVKGVEGLTLREVAAEVERLTQAARDGRVDPADLKGGTISISNIGALGGTHAMPIINMPEVAIVALGRIQRLPRFAEDGLVVSRAIMTVTWSGDHRVLDGGTMARFCNRWKDYLEAPQSMLSDMR